MSVAGLRARGPRVLVLLAVVMGARPVRAQGWVEPFSELAPAPIDLHDARRPLAERVRFARELGRFGPQDDAVTVLLDALDRDLPIELRQAVYYALALRAPPRAEAPLLARLRKEAVPSRGLCLALAALATPGALEGLVSALSGKGSPAIAQRALLQVGSAAAVPLARALGRADAVLAARTLEQLGPEAHGARVALESALGSHDRELALASARALGALGDARAAVALGHRLPQVDAELAAELLLALSKVGTGAQASVLLAYREHATGPLRGPWLRAFARVSPRAAASHLQRAMLSPQNDPALHAAALEALLSQSPDPSWLPLYERLLAQEPTDALASAVARVEAGRGLDVLVRVARRSREATRRLSRALAIALRRFGEVVEESERRAGYALLRSLPAGPRRLRLRGLARDPELVPEALSALVADDRALRAAAATALGWLDSRSAAPALLAALERERDPEAVRRMLEALASAGQELPGVLLARLARDRSTAPDALALATMQAPAEHALRVELRRLLSGSHPARLRVSAALGLGRLQERTALPALVAALDDPSARLRLAVVHALGAIDDGRARDALKRQLRIEADALVRAAAREVLARAAGAPSRERACTQVLEARVLGDALRAGAEVDVLLDDGRWIRTQAGEGGEILIPDLPDGDAEVRVVD